jgi:sensor c-di-GMP phosphodiesterase-like protein
VETAAQADWLRRAGCDYAQGFHYARPLPPEAFEAALSQLQSQQQLQRPEAAALA